MFFGHSFYFRMFDNSIKRLISSGVMRHLVKIHYNRKWKFEKNNKHPKVLNVDDLLFGFKIWQGCCLTALFAFVSEKVFRFFRPIKKLRKVKYEKVVPLPSIDIDISLTKFKMNLDLVKKFRIKSLIVENIEESESDECLEDIEEALIQETTSLEHENSTISEDTIDHLLKDIDSIFD